MFSLTDHQFSAVRKARDWYQTCARFTDEAPTFAFAGYAGTGKSTVLPFIIQEMGLQVHDVAFVAPTGKAARVMSKKMTAMGMPVTATTIHKAIYRPKALKADMLERDLSALRESLHSPSADTKELTRKIRQVEKDLDRAYDSTDMAFQLNVDADLKAKSLIVVDEASMVGERIAEDLRSFGVPVLAIGDPGQLPPVNDHAGLMIGEPDALLSEIHRQAADNPIIWFATELRNRRLPDFGTHGTALRIVRPRDDDRTYNIEQDNAIVCGMNRTRWKITTKLRDLMGYGPTGPVCGEPLICIKNSIKHPGLVNGLLAWCSEDVGELQEGHTGFRLATLDEDDVPRSSIVLQQPFEAHYLGGAGTAHKSAIFRARKETEQFDWAYALTAHKLQGSQADHVVVHDEMGAFGEDAWRWAYTAATRAAQTLTWVTR